MAEGEALCQRSLSSREEPLVGRTAVAIGLSLTLVACTGDGGGGGDGSLQTSTGASGSSGQGGGGGVLASNFRVAFGSCSHQDAEQPILWDVVDEAPDLFVYLGDNIYGDTFDMAVLQSKYDKLGAKPEFEALWNATQVLATWDDHDYGQNDAGKWYLMKDESKAIFLDFWQVPSDSDRYSHEGIYTSHLFGNEGARVQLLLLDTRWFRDNLSTCTRADSGCKHDYKPHPDDTTTLLGAEQWAWLEAELAKPAEVRIIASSIQFSHAYNGWESWTNLPHEQEKMLALIRDTGANGVVFISGDVHWGELSKRSADGGYPVYDVTSSGITQTWSTPDENSNRLGEPESKNNFGMIEIDWLPADPTIRLAVTNVDGLVTIEHTVALSELQVP